jgi:formamidopyrimidine-DNA glycosylase
VPELPDIEAYLHALRPRVVGQPLRRLRLGTPFLLRTVTPRPAEFESRQVLGVARLGKRVVLELEGDQFAVIHLMIAGRLHWRLPAAKVGGKMALAAFDFDEGTLTLTEAGSKRRAALHLLQGREALRALDRGGLELLDPTTDLAAFREALTRESHTVKRSLADPRLFSGIGNAYSDEILHRARLSPVRLTRRLTDEEIARLFDAIRAVLEEWTARLCAEADLHFPEKVTAFRPEMAVHGRHNQPCPDCASPVQRISYADNECNYCAVCQNAGRVLADRAMSRLLKEDWPRTLADLEERMGGGDPAKGK